MKNFVQRLGALRVMLLVLSLVVAAAMSWVDISMLPEGLGLLRAAVLPAIAPILLVVIMLDILMCQILKADEEVSSTKRRDLVFICKVHLLVAAILFLSWVPIFLRATL